MKDEHLYRKGVIVMVIDTNDHFLIVQLQSYQTHEWNFVGGGQEGNETPQETLIRVSISR